MKYLLAALAFVALATPGSAAQAATNASDFADKVAVANKFEIETSQLALKYGKSADVKKFAQQMIDDHTKAGQDFKAAVARANIKEPADALDATHEAKYAKLRLFTTENSFDRSYVSEQLQAHKEAVDLFRDYSQNGEPGPNGSGLERAKDCSLTAPAHGKRLRLLRWLASTRRTLPRTRPSRS